MKRLAYPGGIAVLGDELGEAVLDYATAIAMSGGVGIATIDSVGADGTSPRVRILVGPATQLSLTDMPDSALRSDDRELVEELRRQTAALKGARTQRTVARVAGSTETDLDRRET